MNKHTRKQVNNIQKKLYKKCIQRPHVAHENKYKRYRNLLTDIIRKAKRSYFAKEFEKNKTDSKQTWKVETPKGSNE